jgi:hypothetical protein
VGTQCSGAVSWEIECRAPDVEIPKCGPVLAIWFSTCTVVASIPVLLAPVWAGAPAMQPLGCVTPRATIDRHTHRLNRIWVDVFSKPDARAPLLSLR